MVGQTSAAQSQSAASAARQKLRRNMFGGAVGNILEWYDFAVFGFFAPIIGTQFFPSDDGYSSLLAAFGAFAGAYFARPLGGAIFGNMGDRLGRKRALQVSVMVMAVSTTLIGILPTYSSIGYGAGLLLILLRLMQGLSVGGELVGSISFITEIAPANRRGFYGSFSFCSATGGMLLGSVVATLATSTLSAAAMQSWGWRIPFLAGIAIGLFGLWMRTGLEETAHFSEGQESGNIAANPVLESIRTMPWHIVQVVALVALEAGGFYTLFVWVPTYLTELIFPPVSNALILNSFAMLLLTALIPVFGWLSDIFGRRTILMLAAASMAVFAYPLWSLLRSTPFPPVLFVQTCFAVIMAAVGGPLPAAMAELFPTRNRYSGIAIGYNIALAVFGGMAPLFCTWMVTSSSNRMAPAFWLIGLAVLSLGAAAIKRPNRMQVAAPVPLANEAVEDLRPAADYRWRQRS